MAHIYHIKCILAKGGEDQAWISLAFHWYIADCRAIDAQTEALLTHLDKIVHRDPTHLGFCNASGLGARGVCNDPSRADCIIVLRHHWPPYISSDLVLVTNPEGSITNSDLNISSLILHDNTLLVAVLETSMAAP